MPSQPYRRSWLVNCAGINNSVSDELIADNELADARNLIPDYNGGGNLVKRPGLVANSYVSAGYAANSSAWDRTSAYVGKFAKYFTDGVTITGTPTTYTFNVYVFTIDAEGDQVAPSVYNSANKPGNLAAWATFAGYDLYVDASHAIKTNDGTNFTAIANIPANRICIEAYNSYLFALINNSFSLRWSDQEDPETWDTTHELVFALQKADDALLSLRKSGSELAVLGRRQVFFIQGYGPRDFTVAYTLENVGAANHALTCSTPFGLFWWSDFHGLCWSRDNRSVDFPMLRKLRGTFFDGFASFYTPLNGFMFFCPDKMCVSCMLGFQSPSPTYYERVDYYPANDAFYISRYTPSANSFWPCAVAVDDTNYLSSGRAVYYVIQRDRTVTTGKCYVRRESETVSTDVGDAVTAYAKTKRAWGPVNPIVNNESNKVMLTTNLPAEGAVTYGYYQDNATALTQSFSPTIGTGVQDTEFGINASYRKIQHYVSDALAGRTKYIALHELGD